MHIYNILCFLLNDSPTMAESHEKKKKYKVPMYIYVYIYGLLFTNIIYIFILDPVDFALFSVTSA